MTRRWRPKNNRRITFVTVTEAGVSLVEAVRADLDEAVAGLYEIYDADDRQRLHDLLVRVVEAGGADLLAQPAGAFSRS